MSNIYETIYVNEYGQLYQVDIPSLTDIPEFGQDNDGNLIYRYNVEQTVNTFIISNNGILQSNLDLLSIDNNGRLSAEEVWTLINDTQDQILQKNINLLRSHNKKVQMKVTLYDENYDDVEDLTGKIKSCEFDKTLSSDIRDTCTLTLSLAAKEQIDLDFEKTWNKRMVDVFCGLFYVPDNQYIWYKMGRLLMSGGSTRYNATTQEVKLNLVDLLASLTQERGSQIGTSMLFLAGSNVRNALISIISTYSQFKRYNICEFEDTIPYDLDVDIGSYPIDAINTILDLFPTYEKFYDSNGVFTVQKIPTKINDPIEIDSYIIDDMLISESRSVDFSEVKNTTEIWGRELSGDYVAKSCTTSGNTYNVVIDETFTELVDGETYTIVPLTNSVAGQKMKIQNTQAYSIYTASGAGEYTPIVAGTMIANIPYVIRYFEERFILQGELKVRCIVQEITAMPSPTTQAAYKESNACDDVQWIVNPDSPFACWLDPTTGNIEGEIKQVLQGGEYEGIYTTELAFERAKYENWLKCRLQDTIEIETILIPWMELNQKIRFTAPVSGELETWIVQSISYNIKEWTMTIKASRFYPYYPW